MNFRTRNRAFFLFFMALGWGLLALAQGVPSLPPPQLGPPPSAPMISPGGTAAGGAVVPAPSSGSTAGPLPGATSAPAPVVPSRPLPPVTISAELDKPTVACEDTLQLIITLSFEQSASEPALPLDFEFPNPPSATGLTLFGNSFQSTTELSGNQVKIKRVYTYNFRADQEGKTEVKPVSINYFWMGSPEKKTLSTQALPVVVTKAKLRPGKALRHPAAMVGIGVVLVLAVGLLAWPWVKERRKVKPEEAPKVSVHDLARERLREADRLRLAGEYSEFLFALSAEVNRYLEEALKIKARGVSAEKVVAEVAAKLGEEWRARLTEFHKLCDKVKFAGHRPETRELDQATETAKLLIAEGEKAGEKTGEKKG